METKAQVLGQGKRIKREREKKDTPHLQHPDHVSNTLQVALHTHLGV